MAYTKGRPNYNKNPRVYTVNVKGVSKDPSNKRLLRYKVESVVATSKELARAAAVKLAEKYWPNHTFVAKGAKWERDKVANVEEKK